MSYPSRRSRSVDWACSSGPNLDRDHFLDQIGQHRRLVPGAGAHLQHPVLRPQLEGLGHQRDDVGLGDGLPVVDRQGRVAVGAPLHALGHEQVARHLAHHFQHQRVVDVARGELALDHGRPRPLRGASLAHLLAGQVDRRQQQCGAEQQRRPPCRGLAQAAGWVSEQHGGSHYTLPSRPMGNGHLTPPPDQVMPHSISLPWPTR